jgi:hypothetical protein
MPRIIMVPSGVDHYRAKAAECEQMANSALDPDVQREFANLASKWAHLAKQAEQAEQADRQER